MTTQLAVSPPVSLGRIRRAGWVRVTYGVHRPLELADERLADLASWQQVLPNSGAFTQLTGAMVRGWWLPPWPAELPVFAEIMDAEPRPRRGGSSSAGTPKESIGSGGRAAGRHTTGDPAGLRS